MSRRCRTIAAALAILVTWSLLLAQATARESLDRARDALVALRFEEALQEIDALLVREILEDERFEALSIATEANVALGNWRSVEDGYESLLRLRPDFAPDPARTPQKAMERYRKVHARLVGALAVRAVPADATITVDGGPREPDAAGTLAVLAGRHVVRAEARGFDPAEREVEVAAGATAEVAIELVPNARTVVVETEEEDVAVSVDGSPVGTTVRPPRVAGEPPPMPQAVVPFLPLGVHSFVLEKRCFEGQRIERVIAVDLADPAPERIGPVALRPARGDLIVQGKLAGASVTVDGEPAGVLPTRPVVLCPDRHRVVVAHEGRRVWESVETVRDGEERLIEVFPRPNALLVGIDRWPEELVEVARTWNEPELRAAPPGWQPSDGAAWRALDLPSDVDLVVTADASGSAVAYGPATHAVVPIASGRTWKADRPAWGRWTWGLATADSDVGGPALVVDVVPDGAAASAGIEPGDRILAVGGKAVAAHAAVRAALDEAAWDAAVDLAWRTPAGEEKTARVPARWSPRLLEPPSSPAEALVRAAWARVDGVTNPEVAAAALVNLAALEAATGDRDRAIETLGRVRFPERPGFGQGSVDYLLGTVLLAAGRRDEAVEAFRRAAAGSATAGDDEGPPVAAAARAQIDEIEAQRSR